MKKIIDHNYDSNYKKNIIKNVRKHKKFFEFVQIIIRKIKSTLIFVFFFKFVWFTII